MAASFPADKEVRHRRSCTEDTIVKKPLRNIGPKRSLTPQEDAFITAAENGDLNTIRDILSDRMFNVDCSDSIGRTPLRLAVDNEHVEIVKILLQRCRNASIREAVLQAINTGNVQITELALRCSNARLFTKGKHIVGEDDYFFSNCWEDSQYSHDITPLILASKGNHFQIVQLLLRRGETITKPHPYNCNCRDCSNKLQFDELRLAKTRLNAYRGLASEAYISLSSKDPILTAFALGKELRGVAEVEKCYKTEYLTLSDQLSKFVVKLLDKVRGHDELEVVLNKVGDSDDDEESMALGRVQLAIEYEEKKFVSHPCCQQKLVSIWYANLRGLETANWLFKILLCCFIAVSYPVLAVCFWVAPDSKIGKFLRTPCIKFIGHLMSFIMFLVMILVISLTKGGTRKLSTYGRAGNISGDYLSKDCTNTELLCDFMVRRSQYEMIEIFLGLWIVGMFWQELLKVFKNGFPGYFNSIFNYLDSAVMILYLTAMCLVIACRIKVAISIKYFEDHDSWRKLEKNDNEARLHLYWLIADRFHWNESDPDNVAEAAFAIANIISITRVCYFFPANNLMGPLQISLARMAKEVLKFMVIFMVLFAAFMVGLHNLYWYYPQETRNHMEVHKHNITTTAEQYFGIHQQTFRTIFWTSLGHVEAKAVELHEGYDFGFTTDVGYWIFGAYNVAIVIVLINMLIAMMTRSFDTFQSEADTEWKYARSKLYMEYIRDDSILTVPFNLIPTPRFLLSGLLSFRRTEADQADNPAGNMRDSGLFTSNHSGDIKFEGKHEALTRQDTEHNMYCDTPSYKFVINRIIRRYILDMQRVEGDDSDSAKKDATSVTLFRRDVLNLVHEIKRETGMSLQRMNEQLECLLSE